MTREEIEKYIFDQTGFKVSVVEPNPVIYATVPLAPLTGQLAFATVFKDSQGDMKAFLYLYSPEMHLLEAA